MQESSSAAGPASVVDRLLSRGGPPPDAPLAPAWDRFLDLLLDDPGAGGGATAEVLANLIAIAAYGDDQDCADLLTLAEEHGEEKLARLQHQAIRQLGDDLDVDLAVLVAVRLKAVAFDAGDPVDDLAAQCGVIGVRMLLHGIDEVDSPRRFTTAGELVEVIDRPGFDLWRQFAAGIMESPWSPYASRVVELAQEAGRPDIAAGLQAVTEIGRELVRSDERRQVAAEVRRLVEASGLSQAKFAQRVGTSPSRFSTYVSGRVVPSAAMLLRMSREVEVVQRERRDAEGGRARSSADRPA